MKSHNISLISSFLLITMSGWGYLSSETPSVTALIPLFFVVILLLCYPGIKKENKIISHIAVTLTLLVFLALFMPLKGALGREDNGAFLRISLDRAIVQASSIPHFKGLDMRNLQYEK